ncbi:MAG: two-component regulator propeller domain-containing protein [Steroidobacteraceae bacterium]
MRTLISGAGPKETTPRAVHLVKALLIAALLHPVAALAGESPRRLAAHTHQSWTEDSEAPAPVLAMAQGRDGFLWLATGEGLFRFDGVSFEPIRPEGNPAQNDYPTTVFVARNGDVWTSFKASRRFAVYRAGALRFLDAPRAPAWIMTIAESADDAIWALPATFAAEVLRFQNGRWERFDAARGAPGDDDGLSMVLGDDGAVWISTTGAVSRLAPGGTRFEVFRETERGNGRLSVDPDGRIWISERRGSYPLTGPGGHGAPPALRAPYPTDDAQIRGAPQFDRAGNLWIATHYDGVQRIASADPQGPPEHGDAKLLVEAIRSSDGLSSHVTNQILEDREGNVWIGTEKGLDRFRPATLRSEPALTSPAAFGDKLMAAADGSVYIGEAKTIYHVRPGGAPEPILQNIVEPQSICEAPDGALWIVFSRHVMVWKNGHTLKEIDRPNTPGISYDCAFDKHGDFWFSAHGGGLNRYRNGKWEEMFGPVGSVASLPIEAGPSVPTTMERDAQGRLVVQFGRQLAWIDGAARRLTPLDFGAGEPKVLTLYAAPNGDMFAAGAFGLTRYRGGKSETIWTARAAESNRINGVVQTPDGETWIAYPRNLVRIGASELERAFTTTHAFAPPALSLGVGDGLTSRPHSHTQRAMVQGGDGRIWIATETGMLWMDPKRIERNDLPPGVAIKSLTADSRLYRDPALVNLPAATSHIQIDYAALSFADPKHARVRYKLQGFDLEWLDPGTRRQAFYTNLSPGKYRFHVIAANTDGVWNRGGVSVDFEIPPTFLQSRWFLALCVVLSLALLWLLYRLRVAQVAARIRNRLEERLSERERIARELHDTLLQGVQGLILRFQSVATRMPRTEPSRALLEAALKRADEVIIDGRKRVHDLRTDDESRDLQVILRELADDAGFDPPIPIRVVVEGKSRPIHDLVSTEVRRIAGEALFNIARHARATSVDATITFGEQQLGLQIRDDGVGIEQGVLALGHKQGHFGLIGMRERAERTGGTLSIDSGPGKGTDVMLTLPARVAYKAQVPTWRKRLSWRGSRRSSSDVEREAGHDPHPRRR